MGDNSRFQGLRLGAIEPSWLIWDTDERASDRGIVRSPFIAQQRGKRRHQQLHHHWMHGDLQGGMCHAFSNSIVISRRI